MEIRRYFDLVKSRTSRLKLSDDAFKFDEIVSCYSPCHTKIINGEVNLFICIFSCVLSELTTTTVERYDNSGSWLFVVVVAVIND